MAASMAWTVTSTLQVGHLWQSRCLALANQVIMHMGWNICLQVFNFLNRSNSLNFSMQITHSVVPNSSIDLSALRYSMKGIILVYFYITRSWANFFSAKDISLRWSCSVISVWSGIYYLSRRALQQHLRKTNINTVQRQQESTPINTLPTVKIILLLFETEAVFSTSYVI